ncbi:MAG: 50S ribosomal protein L9 [Lachnospiraceae bacterium]|jgi:large subunit ribosomal protein L9|nr:50S ribosomal protein L9 [Lachnospiraceae bacterium]MBR6999925.1 50S ribosomal protein L9 [Lachnospiraceae bacterium]
MDIILIQDVKSLGKKGEIVKVSDGYARNFILPKKLGLEANAKNLNDLKLQKAAQAKLEKEQLEAAQELGKKIDGSAVTIRIKTGENGRVFGSVSVKEIAEAMQEQLGLTIDKKKISLANPIRNEGTFTASVKLHPQVTSELTVKVEGN